MERLNHYRIIEKLGAGGMGEVYAAEDTRLGRTVALKVLPRGLATNPDRLLRFQREAKLLASLSHPNIVTLYSAEEDAGVPFLTMELVEGRTLQELIPPGGLPLPEILELAEQLVDALDTAHRQGIVHRDLKPANVMVDDEGRLKVLDFGLAKLFEPGSGEDLPAITSTGEELTETGQVLGTVPYMSPEQARGLPLDGRSDIFSIGTMLYQMCTGRRPFAGSISAEWISAILRDTPPPVTELRPELPERLARIVERCLEKEPEARHATAGELLEELEALNEESLALATRSLSKVQMAPKPASTDAPPLSTEAPAASERSRASRQTSDSRSPPLDRRRARGRGAAARGPGHRVAGARQPPPAGAARRLHAAHQRAGSRRSAEPLAGRPLGGLHALAQPQPHGDLPAARRRPHGHQPDGRHPRERLDARLLARRPVDRVPLGARERRPLHHGSHGRVGAPHLRERLQPGLVAGRPERGLCHRAHHAALWPRFHQRAVDRRACDGPEAPPLRGRRGAAVLVPAWRAHRLLEPAGGHLDARALEHPRRGRRARAPDRRQVHGLEPGVVALGGLPLLRQRPGRQHEPLAPAHRRELGPAPRRGRARHLAGRVGGPDLLLQRWPLAGLLRLAVDVQPRALSLRPREGRAGRAARRDHAGHEPVRGPGPLPRRTEPGVRLRPGPGGSVHRGHGRHRPAAAHGGSGQGPRAALVAGRQAHRLPLRSRGQVQIWAIGPDGGGLERLTQTPGESPVNALWSPDGKHLAYGVKGGRGFLLDWTTRSQTPPERLPEAPGYPGWAVSGGAWSPDGKKLLVGLFLGNDLEISALYSIESRQYMSIPNFVRGKWSPDGRKLAGSWVREAGRYAGVLVYSLDTGKTEQLTDAGGEVLWLPDSRRLIYREGRKLLLLDTETKAKRELITPENPITLSINAIAPDGRTLYGIRTTDESTLGLATLE